MRRLGRYRKKNKKSKETRTAIVEPSHSGQIRHVLTVVTLLDVSFALLTRLRSEVIAFTLSVIEQEVREQNGAQISRILEK